MPARRRLKLPRPQATASSRSSINIETLNKWLLWRRQSPSNYMTKHNLGEHLTWLLTSNPSKPPSAGPAIENLHLNTGLNERFETPPQPSVPSGSVDEELSFGNGERSSAVENHPPPSRPIITSDDEDMARLQSAPRSSKKSRLMVSQMNLGPIIKTPKASQTRVPDPSPRVGPVQGNLICLNPPGRPG